MKCVIKTLILYHSLTGNTCTIARAIYDECSCFGAADISPLEEITEDILDKYDVVFIGSPCHVGDLSQLARDFLDSLRNSLPVFLAGFFTHSAPMEKEQEYIQCMNTFTAKCGLKNIPLAGVFHCQGFLTPDLHDMIKKARGVSDKEWNKTYEDMHGHPDSTDKTNARAFASKIMRSLLENQNNQ